MRRHSGDSSQGPSQVTPHEWIDTDGALRDFVSYALGHDEYFIDTEFHREKTYFPRLALVQIGVGDRIVLIDPLTVDTSLLRPLFESDSLAVFHAAQQDLDVMTQSMGFVPSRIFDTQLAAGFIGYSSPSLVNLAASLLKVTIPKGDRLTDWLRRPLTNDQRNYAASDVVHLPELMRLINADLERRGRAEWSKEACEELRTRPVGPTDPDDAWLRVKDVRTVKGKSRWVAQSVARWREERAMNLDIPPRHVMSDIALLSVAQRCPRNGDELSSCRGIDGRLTHGNLADALLSAVRAGLSRAEGGELAFPAPEGEDLEKSMRPAVTLVGVWVSELARQSDLDPTLLGTRKDIVDLLAGNKGARLAEGWRADILGRDVELLIQGRMALTFRNEGSDVGLAMVPVEPTK